MKSVTGLKTGAWEKKLKQRPWQNDVYCPAQLLILYYLSYTKSVALPPRVRTTLGPLISIHNQESAPTNTPIGQSDGDNFSVEIFFSHMIDLHQVDKKTNYGTLPAPSLRKVRAETQVRNHGGILLTCLLPGSCSSSRATQSSYTCLGRVLPIVDWPLLHQLMPYKHAHRSA